jgi:hypothetical protein
MLHAFSALSYREFNQEGRKAGRRLAVARKRGICNHEEHEGHEEISHGLTRIFTDREPRCRNFSLAKIRVSSVCSSVAMSAKIGGVGWDLECLAGIIDNERGILP